MIHKSYLVEKNINILKNEFALFYGENLGMQKDFKNIITKQNLNSEIVRLDQEDIIKNPDFLFTEILNLSLFDKGKIFFISNANDKILPIIQNLEKKIEKQKIYLFSNSLEKKSKLRSYFEKSNVHDIVPCYVDNEIDLKNIIFDKLKNFKGLNSENLNLIIENSNYDRIKLNNELNKIILYFENRIILTDKLFKLLNLEVNENFNTVKDEAINGNKIKTNKLLNNSSLDQDKSMFYISLLNQRFDKLKLINQLKNDDSLEQRINLMRPPIFWKDKPMFLMQAKKWNLKNINKIQNEIYEAEIKIKTTSLINKNILLKKLLIDICNLANAA
tara:strand:- start:84 stop:1076 length:993 start_codon:yes stop_codon:yes gene_type:complete